MKSRFLQSLGKRRHQKTTPAVNRRQPLRRGHFETLEDRRLLASVPFDKLDPEDFVANELIVGFTDNASLAVRNQLIGSAGGSVLKRWDRFDMVLGRFTGNLETISKQLESSPYVRYAEPNYRGVYEASPGVFPNDPLFAQLWGLNNNGQIPNFGNPAPIPIEDSDIDAPEGWAISVGTSDVVVAIFDSGTDYTHPDLLPNMWVNPGEIPGNALDDDGNGFVDDVYGADTFNLDGDPMDDYGHGTHVSGTAAAKGDNGIGVTGVSWNAQIMALKVGGPIGPTSAGVIGAANYVIAMKEQGVNVVVSNHAYGLGDIFSQADYDAFQAQIDAGILPVMSAGNAASNNDLIPTYPANYDFAESLVVAATDKDDSLAVFSQYGFNSVDLAAPGVDIFSTSLRVGALSDPSGYSLLDGTSMAAPHVTGAVAVLRSLDPTLTVMDAKNIIMGGVDKVSTLRRIVVSEGRLNLEASLRQLVAGQIRGLVWNDVDGDGRFDNLEDLGLPGDAVLDEDGLAGWTVFLDLDSDGRLDSGETSTLTAADGSYTLPVFSGPGTYTVSVQKRLAYTQTSPSPLTNSRSVTLEFRDQVVTRVDFGYRPEPAIVSGVKFDDQNGNRRRDAGEPGLKDWTIYVDMDGDGRIDLGEPQARTDNLGRYTIQNVPASTAVTVREVPQAGWVQTLPGGVGYHTLTLQPLEERVGIHFGNNQSMANDFGDAPAPYPTLLSQSGPRHGIMAGMHLGPSVAAGGAGVDAEADGFQIATDATQTDDTTNVDDEDGVVFTTALAPGRAATVQVTVTLGSNQPGLLQGWIDFNRDGDWTDTGEQVFTNLRLGEGVHNLTINVPGTAQPGPTHSRFRYGYETNLGLTGSSLAGEVEDHPVSISSLNPIATDDTFIVQQSSRDNRLNVLANDIPGVSGRASMRLRSVSAAGASGTATVNDNGTPADYTDDFIAYTPAPGALAPDAFSYTIEDVLTGATDTAVVNITIVESGGLTPVAVDDSFTVSVTTNLDVLANDRRGPTGSISIPANGLDITGTVGLVQLVTVSIGGQQVQQVRYTPSPGFAGSDQFRYTIVDTNSIQDTAVVTIHVPPSTADDVVRFRLATTDLLGQPITRIGQGMQFQVRGFIRDMRNQPGRPPLQSGLTPADQGLFSAYMDVLYNSGQVSYAGPLTFSSEYSSGRFFDATVPGILDEVGAFQGVGSAPLGNGEQLLFTATFTASNKGVVTFKADPADVLPLHETTLNRPPEPSISFQQIEFGTTSIEVIDSPTLVQVRLATTALNGAPLPNNSVTAGTEFFVKAWVDDIRGLPNEGLYSAYLDVFYNPSLAVPVPSLTNPLGFDISFTDELGNPNFWADGRKGSIAASGIIDEVGAFQGSSAQLFSQEKLLFTARFRALAPTGGIGTLVFQADPADNLPLNEITLIRPEPGISVPTAQVRYVSAPPVSVIGVGAEAEFTNPDNPFDVTNDGVVSPLDVLYVISFINQNGVTDLNQWLSGAEGEARGYYYDVTGDMVISAMDALACINYVNGQSVAGAGGEGEASVAVAPLLDESLGLAGVLPAADASTAASIAISAQAAVPAAPSDGDEDLSYFVPSGDAAEDELELHVSDALAADVLQAWGDRSLLDDLLIATG